MKNIFRIFMIWIFVTIFLCLTVSAADDAYSFGVLRYVEKSGNSYTANIYIDGKNQNFVLNSSSAIETDTMVFTAEELYDFYKIKSDENGDPVYNYLIVCGIEEKSGGYTLYINTNPDKELYKILPSGTTISYRYVTGLYTVGNINKVILDSNSKVYYQYVTPGSNEEPAKVGEYSSKQMSGSKDYTVKTCGDTYLVYDASKKWYYLLATMIPDGVTGVTDPNGSGTSSEPSYATNGDAIAYAYKTGTQRASNGVIYNYNYFMNMTNVTNLSGAIDKRREYHSTFNKEAEGGYFYGKNDVSLTYDKITRSVVDSVDTMELGTAVETLKTGSGTLLLVDTSRGEEICRLTDSTLIWGLYGKNSLQDYRRMAITGLDNMIALVDDYNTQKGTNVKIDVLIIYKDESRSEVSTLVVESFNKDASGNVVSANDTIFRNLGIAPDVTPTDKVFVSCDKTEYYDTDSIKVTWNSLTNATGYVLNVADKTGNIVYTKNLSGKSNTQHTLSLDAGTYFVTVETSGVSNSQSNAFEIKVLQKYYTVSYYANGGVGAPECQKKTTGKGIALSTSKPTREGYMFMGWALTPFSCTPVYSGGQYFYDDNNVELFAVWMKKPEFVGASLTIGSDVGIRVYMDVKGEFSTDSVYIYYKIKDRTMTTSQGMTYLSFDSEKNLYYSEFFMWPSKADSIIVECQIMCYEDSDFIGTFSVPALIAEYKDLAKSDAKYAEVLGLVNALEMYMNQANAFVDKAAADDFRVDMGYVTPPSKSGSATAIRHVSTSLLLYESIRIRHYFVLDNNKSHTYKCNGANVQVINFGQGIVAVDIYGITPDKFDTAFTLTVDGTLNISYSVLNYAKAMADDTRVGSLVNAMYNYWYYAKEYVNK